MDRRTIIATAGAITLTVLAGSAAIAANVGILGDSSKGPVGQLSPIVSFEPTSTAPRARHADTSAVTTTTLPAQVETVYVDEYVPASGGSSPAAAPVVVPPAAPAAPVTGEDDGAVSPTSVGDSGASDDDGSDDGGDDDGSDDGHYGGGEGDD